MRKRSRGDTEHEGGREQRRGQPPPGHARHHDDGKDADRRRGADQRGDTADPRAELRDDDRQRDLEQHRDADDCAGQRQRDDAAGRIAAERASGRTLTAIAEDLNTTEDDIVASSAAWILVAIQTNLLNQVQRDSLAGRAPEVIAERLTAATNRAFDLPYWVQRPDFDKAMDTSQSFKEKLLQVFFSRRFHGGVDIPLR